jgi:predicted lipoprotein with Yx(FWY)xxD motif
MSNCGGGRGAQGSTRPNSQTEVIPMKTIRLRAAVTLTLLLIGAVALAACGSSDSSSTSTDTSASTSAAAGQAGGDNGTVDLADNSALGAQILVDDKGQTLYLFEKDDTADESYCYDACAKAWPPLTTTGTVTVGSGLDASQLTTFKRDDGTTQAAYAGHPLYYYAGDSAPGDANGNGLDQFGAEWYAMDANGDTVEGGGSSGGDTTSSDTTSSGSSSDSTSGYSSY